MEVSRLVRNSVKEVKPYIPGKPVEEVQRELGLQEIIKLASNENLIGPSPKALKAIKENLLKLNYYPDSSCYYLVRALAAKHGVSGEQIIVGSGADELIHHLMLVFIEERDEVIAAYPSFVMYEIATKVVDGSIILVGLKDFRHDLPEMLDKITSRTKLVFICNPNNPTGTIVTADEVETFMNSLPDNVVVVFDEAYREYVEADDFPDSLNYLNQGRKVVILRTFSKIYGLAGLRIGYGFTSQEIASYVNRVRGPFNVNSLAQAAAIAALEDEEHVRKSQQLVWEGKKYLYDTLTKMGIAFVPTEANFILVEVGKDADSVFQALLREGVIVRSGKVLGFPFHIRVTIGHLHQNEKFIKSLRKILAVK